MSTAAFLLALAGLAGGTYLIRLLGVQVGALAQRGPRSEQAAEGEQDARDEQDTTGGPGDGVGPGHHPGAGPAAHVPSDPPARQWTDRATVVLICAVAVTTLLFEGHDVVGPARILGGAAGMAAALLRVPMLVCVLVAMGVCAGLRAAGMA